jgi:hypothetical protein
VDLLDRLYARLLEVRRSPTPPSDDRPITVGDLYQRIIPYRTVRDALGVLELAEYEHALLRLLAGERGYVRVLDGAVREEVQRELASVNPILGIFRDYAATPVEVREAALPVAESGDPSPGAARRDRVAAPESDAWESQPAASQSKQTPAIPSETPSPVAAVLRSGDQAISRPAASAAPERHQGGASRSVGPCGNCHRTLPQLDDVRFCPFCGAVQRPLACAGCGAPLEAGWSFCIRCGSGRGG